MHRCARVGIDARRARSTKISHSLRTSPGRRPVDLGAERDAAFGGGLGAAVALFVAGRGREEHDHLAGIDQHLAGHDDVLVDPQRHPRQCRLDRGGIGQHLEEVAARRVEDVDLAAPSGLDHLLGRDPGPVADGEAVLLGQRGGVGGVDVDASGERGRVRAHLGAALHPRVPADGHETGAGPTDVAARQARG